MTKCSNSEYYISVNFMMYNPLLISGWLIIEIMRDWSRKTRNFTDFWWGNLLQHTHIEN
jgi:hypothetical protein